MEKDINKIEKTSLEQNLKELEAISSKLDDSSISLEEAMQAFERAVLLTKQCTEMVKLAEGKVLELKKDMDTFVEMKKQEE